MMALDRLKYVGDNVIYILFALYLQAVGFLIIRNTAAGCSDSHTKHVNAFCRRDIEIPNIKPCDNIITTGPLMGNYLSTFAEIKLNYETVKYRGLTNRTNSEFPIESSTFGILVLRFRCSCP
jgi:hypothetical protein